MLELLALVALAVAAAVVIGVLGAACCLLWWLICLPFKLLGLVFKGLAFLLALPFMILAGVLGAVAFGAGILIFFVPLLPLLLLGLLVWWLVRRRPAGAAPAST